jgi:hypothetical protein
MLDLGLWTWVFGLARKRPFIIFHLPPKGQLKMKNEKCQMRNDLFLAKTKDPKTRDP